MIWWGGGYEVSLGASCSDFKNACEINAFTPTKFYVSDIVPTPQIDWLVLILTCENLPPVGRRTDRKNLK